MSEAAPGPGAPGRVLPCRGVRRLLASSLALLAACAGDGDPACEPPAPACYEMRVTVGTGTCDPQRVRALLEPLGTWRPDGDLDCGRHLVTERSAEDGCAVDARVEVELTASGPARGTLLVEGDCSAGGAACEHSFTVEFDQVGGGS